MDDYRTMALKVGATPEHAKAISALAVASEALWRIAQFCINADAPKEEDYDDMESAYGNGEDVALWSDGIAALEALSKMGDAKATELLAVCRSREEERDRAGAEGGEDDEEEA